MTSGKKLPTRILGIDFGLSRLGISLSDESKILATPFQTLKAEKQSLLTAKKLVDLIKLIENDKKCLIEEIIIGLPLMMSGKSGLLSDEVKHFVNLVNELIPVPIRQWDERLTTVQAERALLESNLTRKRRAKMVDVVSAVIILQSYLDHKKIIENRSS